MLCRHSSRPEPTPAARRRGVVVLEFLLVTPVLFIATLALFEFGFLALVLQLGSTAVIEAAREGGKQFPAGLAFDNNAIGDFDPVADNDIADRIALLVDEYLAVHGLEVRQNGINDDTSKANVYLLIERGNQVAERGNNTLAGLTTRLGNPPDADEIVVTVSFRLVDTSDPNGPGNPVPDWLNTFGFTLQPYLFEMSSRAKLE